MRNGVAADLSAEHQALEALIQQKATQGKHRGAAGRGGGAGARGGAGAGRGRAAMGELEVPRPLRRRPKKHHGPKHNGPGWMICWMETMPRGGPGRRPRPHRGLPRLEVRRRRHRRPSQRLPAASKPPIRMLRPPAACPARWRPPGRPSHSQSRRGPRRRGEIRRHGEGGPRVSD